MKKINGISEKRWNRLIGHLERLESLTGGKLIPIHRGRVHSCPIENFAPLCDKNGAKLVGGSMDGHVLYQQENNKLTKYQIYRWPNSVWWTMLEYTTKRKITLAIEKWIAEKKNAKM